MKKSDAERLLKHIMKGNRYCNVARVLFKEKSPAFVLATKVLTCGDERVCALIDDAIKKDIERRTKKLAREQAREQKKGEG